jgi:hypothetical protein
MQTTGFTIIIHDSIGHYFKITNSYFMHRAIVKKQTVKPKLSYIYNRLINGV